MGRDRALQLLGLSQTLSIISKDRQTDETDIFHWRCAFFQLKRNSLIFSPQKQNDHNLSITYSFHFIADSDVDQESDVKSDSLVSTQHGNILGLRETKVDPRQNKSVTWTSYFVNVSQWESNILLQYFLFLVTLGVWISLNYYMGKLLSSKLCSTNTTEE